MNASGSRATAGLCEKGDAMNATIVLPAAIALVTGHRIEVTQNAARVLALTDLDTGVQHVFAHGEGRRWTGAVTGCTITYIPTPQTTVMIGSIVGDGTEAEQALREADAAVEAARKEALRWGGTPNPATRAPVPQWRP